MSDLVLKPCHSLLVVLCLFMAGSAQAMVLFPSDEADIANLTPKPPSGVMVRWGSNASGVMISPNHLITTTHQGGGVGTTVWINGTAYLIAGEVAYPSTDIRVDRVVTLDGKSANLQDYVSLYTTSDERNKTATIGGYGKRRGSALLTPLGNVYGYAWASSDNSILGWGRNKIYSFVLSGSNSFITANFDAQGSANYVKYEAGVAEFDSGGGWFVYNSTSGIWSVMGLTHGTEHASLRQTWFGTATDPVIPDPDVLYAVRVSIYANWVINTAMHSPLIRVPGDLNYDGYVNGSDLNLILTNWNAHDATWSMGDINGDGYVDGGDLNLMLTNWRQQTVSTGAANTTVTASATTAETTIAVTNIEAPAAAASANKTTITPQSSDLDIQINFQPASVTAPTGYLIDSGLPFGARGNGYSYGWTKDLSAFAVRRNNVKNSDIRYDTAIRLSGGGIWEIAIPNGTYDVKIVAGDDGALSAQKFSLEGVPATHTMTKSATGPSEDTVTVVVTDGRLTIVGNPGSSICFVQITGR